MKIHEPHAIPYPIYPVQVGDETTPLIKDECCGQILVNHPFPQRTILWESGQLVALGTITIYYAKGKDRLLVYVNGDAIFSLLANQTRSITLPKIVKLEVGREHGCDESPCVGKYCISIHYANPYQREEQEE